MIFNGEFIHQHCLTGSPKLETYDESAHGMSTDNKRQLILFDVTGLPIENVPRELATCFREVFDNGGTIHAEHKGEPAPSCSPWPELHMQLHNKTFAINIWPQAPSVENLRYTVSKTKTGCASRPMSHINRISMTVYFSLNVQSSHGTFLLRFPF